MILIESSVSPPPFNTTIYLGNHLLQQDILFEMAFSYPKRVLVMDEGLLSLYGSSLASTLNASVFTVPSGEGAKSRAIKEALEDFLVEHKIGRDSLILGLGGGSALDLTAFVASTYMRGIPLVLIPTTLLAMVDAAIGGKTAINTPLGKNLLGTLYFPKAIVIDFKVLDSLPLEEWNNGVAEIIKLGLIAYPQLLDLLKNISFEELIIQSIQSKLEIVKKDPFEKTGLRELLNFGHTFGHAFELLSQYEIPHGKAVALGLLAESHLSTQLGFLPIEKYQQIATLLHTYCSFPLSLPQNYNRLSFYETLQKDKKRKNQPHCVLLSNIGKPALPIPDKYSVPILEKEIESTLFMLEGKYVSNLALSR